MIDESSTVVYVTSVIQLYVTSVVGKKKLYIICLVSLCSDGNVCVLILSSDGIVHITSSHCPVFVSKILRFLTCSIMKNSSGGLLY